MPDPADYDDEDAWMSACVPTRLDEGMEQDQAVASCLNQWRERNKSVGETVNRAYSLLTVKAVEEDQRTIRGVATTPETDRIGDIVEPLGIKFKNPLPLLLHHKHDQPVGHAVFDRATDKGITFSAKIPKLNEPGTLKDRLDEAWQSIKAGLIAGVSIGFKPRDWEPLENGGIRFVTSEVYELSLVTIPANASATISVIKSLDAEQTAASGHSVPANRSRARGTKPVNLKLEERTMSKTIAEQLEALEAKRASHEARMNAIMGKAMDEGRSTEDDEREEFDNLSAEVEQIDSDLKRFRALEKMNLAKAKPVSEVKTIEQGSEARGGGSIRVRGPDLPKGVRFARVVKCLGLAQGQHWAAAQIAERMYGDDQGVVDTLKAAAMGGGLSDIVVKASVPAGTTTETTWAAPLVREDSVFSDFVEFLRPQTVLGKFGTNGIPALRRVPFRTALISQTTGGAGYWVGEGQPKPLTKFDFTKTSLTPTKVANIAVVTEELLRDSSPSAETLVRDSLAAALTAKLDTDFLGAAGAVAGIQPAGITNGVTAVASSGVTQAAVLADIQALMAPFVAAANIPSQGVWIMASTTAMALGLMLTSLGQAAFPSVSIAGGTLYGMPVIVSDYVPGGGGSPNSRMVILLNASDIYLADEGGIAVDMSREASLEMLDNPTNAVSLPAGSPAGQPVHTSMVSLWQVNAVGFRAERTITWAKRRTSAVQMLSNVVWGT